MLVDRNYPEVFLGIRPFAVFRKYFPPYISYLSQKSDQRSVVERGKIYRVMPCIARDYFPYFLSDNRCMDKIVVLLEMKANVEGAGSIVLQYKLTEPVSFIGTGYRRRNK
jgi:hypothetical protein